MPDDKNFFGKSRPKQNGRIVILGDGGKISEKVVGNNQKQFSYTVHRDRPAPKPPARK